MSRRVITRTDVLNWVISLIISLLTSWGMLTSCTINQGTPSQYYQHTPDPCV
jgi:hypothetical protein